MIQFSRLGDKGRLGNQLFEIASLIGIAKKLNTDYEFNEWEYSKYFTNKFPVIQKKLPELKEPEFHYSDKWLKDDRDYNGWLQSEKYFDPEFKFEFEPVFKSLVKAKFSEALSKETIAISIRRGDYIGNPNYFQLPILWYLSALFSIYEDQNIIIFSDDLDFCKIHFSGCYFAEGSDIEQLCLMSMCDTCIIANSTFSWWGAYLSVGRVIHSGKLFSGNLSRNDISDFYPQRWECFEGGRIDLKDVTFLIPVKRDSGERSENLKLNINYLNTYFDTSIIVGEQGTDAFRNLNSIYEKFDDIREFHRTRMLNEMCLMSETPVVVNWDADVFCPVFQIVKSVERIRNGSDMVYPYDGRFVEMTRNEVSKIMELNIKGNYPEPQSFGGAVFFNKESFISGGMENENFISYGPEDLERFERFTKLGFKVERIEGKIYHLGHPRTKDSSNKNPHFTHNWNEFEKVKSMDKEQLENYVKQFKWLLYAYRAIQKQG